MSQSWWVLELLFTHWWVELSPKGLRVSARSQVDEYGLGASVRSLVHRAGSQYSSIQLLKVPGLVGGHEVSQHSCPTG